jgi:RNase H-fold protein (predicted Holliday junction resolvase)
MNRILPNILALDVGAKLIGASVFENKRLVFYAVKSIKKTTEKETLKQLRKVL